MKRTFQFLSHTEQLASVRTFVRQFLDGTPLARQDAEMLVLGIDEACSNIIRHAYTDSAAEGQPIILCCERREETLCFKLRDFGKSVDISKIGSRPLEKVRPGGLGVFLMRQAFDEVNYHPRDVGTELVMTKRVITAAAPVTPAS